MSRTKRVLGSILCSAVILFGLQTGLGAQNQPVRVWEEPLVLPSYKVGAPDPNPIFYNGRVYQGAQGRVYPYPFLEKLTDIREDKSYRAVYLENEYLKICVLPELGGRIFSAEDKTDNYDFFYHQHVIKPALIGMLGAWISGGVEWNIPHHHRASTFMPVDHTLQENPDGSRTVWVGEIELRHRIKWLVGLTLYPGKSYLEATVKIFNRTPLVHSILYWANVSVHADSSYQVIFPPSVEYASGHGKHEFTPWPVSANVYGREGYEGGVDLSWWKNHPSPISLFALDCTEDFVAGYNHKVHAGVVHVADHGLVPGKKLWEWGPGEAGRMWDEILTETDGPYIEIMVGAYSDNQPDYSWIQPYEVKTFHQYWYPLRELGGVKNANLQATLNLEFTPRGKARIGCNTSSEYKNARVLLEAGAKPVLNRKVDISPAKPFLAEIDLPAGVQEEDLKATLFSSSGRELITYRPVKKKGSPMPETVKAPPSPEQIKTIEELYLAGQRLEQFHSAALEPYPFYEEALKRDPGDYRVNTALGILYLRRGMLGQAEERFRQAVQRITASHTRPRDGEAHYYLGVVCKAQGKHSEAEDAFYRATWNQAWYSPGFYSLAELAVLKGDFPQALEFLDRSISTNSLNSKALNLKAAVLRKLGRAPEAESLAAQAVAADPLDFRAGNELYLARAAGGADSRAGEALRELKLKMRGEVQSYLETAADYLDCGLWDEALALLSSLAEPVGGQESSNPLVYYYLGYLSGKKGDQAQASGYYRKAAQMPPDYVFPFRLETVAVLDQAIDSNPGDARAHYYLGNLLFDNQPEKAIAQWEKSRDLDGKYSVVHRNLGLAYARVRNDIPRAIASLEAAVGCNGSDPRLYYELDCLYEAGGVSPQKRLALMEDNPEIVVGRDDLLAREIALYLQSGQYDKALDWLSRRHFHTWEGGGQIHDVYVDARLLRGEKYFRDKKYREALEDYQAALEYPKNLEVGRPLSGGRNSEIYYLIGTACEALARPAEARSFYRKAVEREQRWSEIRYYQGLACRKLGERDRAEKTFDGLIEYGSRRLEAGSATDYFAKFGERQSENARLADAHYLIGLGCLGKGDQARAKQEFEKALKLNINHLQAAGKLAAM